MASCVYTSGSSTKFSLLSSEMSSPVTQWLGTSFFWPIVPSRMLVFVPLMFSWFMSVLVMKVAVLPGSKKASVQHLVSFLRLYLDRHDGEGTFLVHRPQYKHQPGETQVHCSLKVRVVLRAALCCLNAE